MSSVPESPLPPPRVPDHELIRRIGRGAYGEVWIARSVTGAYRAVKILHRRSFDHDRPFEREFEGILKFEPISRTHDSQVDILHVGRGVDHFYYVMELADDQATGGQIQPDTYAARTLKSDLMFRDRLPFEECVRIGLALVTAIEHLHDAGLVHRDVKPSNIIFVNGVPKLADIGLVTGVDATRSFVGTEGFAAPEGSGTAQADLYSLGKVLYEISTGKDRQEFPELPTQLRELPDRDGLMELNAVIAKACRHDPKDRYPSAAAMRVDLELLQGGKSLARLHRMQNQLLLVRRVGILVTVVAVIIGGGWLWQARQTRIMRLLAEENGRLAQENAQLLEFERLQLRQSGILKVGTNAVILMAGPITNDLNGHHYYLLESSKPSEAEIFARSLGGHLATIRNGAEQRWIFETFGNWKGIPRHLCIGLYDPDQENNSTNRDERRREFRWMNGEPVTYTGWSGFEPNSYEGSPENYVHLWAPGLGGAGGAWNDTDDLAFLMGRGMHGVVEVIRAAAKTP